MSATAHCPINDSATADRPINHSATADRPINHSTTAAQPFPKLHSTCHCACLPAAQRHTHRSKLQAHITAQKCV
jgi:hypothetical protein